MCRVFGPAEFTEPVERRRKLRVRGGSVGGSAVEVFFFFFFFVFPMRGGVRSKGGLFCWGRGGGVFFLGGFFGWDWDQVVFLGVFVGTGGGSEPKVAGV